MRIVTNLTQTNFPEDDLPKGIVIGRRTRCLLVAMLFSLPIHPASAQTTWTGGGTNNNWSVSQNWTPVVPPANNGTADVVMAGSVRLTPNIDMPWNVNSLTFNDSAGPFTISGSSLTIGAGGIANQSAAVQNLNMPMVLSANQSWSVGGQDGAYLLANGPVNTNGHSLTFLGGGNGSSGGLLNGGVSGNGSLIVAIAGSSSFASYGTNSYTGGTFLNSGRLFIDGNSSLGAPGSPLTFNGGRLGTGNAFTINREITLGPAGGTMDNSVPQGSFVTLSSTIHGPGSLTLANGKFKLTGTNSYSGGTFVNGSQVVGTTNSLQGNVLLNGVANTALEFAQNFHGTYAGNISGDGGNVVVDGTGIVAFTGNNTYTADTSLDGGVLEVSAAGGGLSPSSRLIFGTNVPASSGGPVLQIVGGGSFTRTSSQVLWNGPGGFAARNGDLAVNIGGNSDQISLDPIASSRHWLVFGSPTANSVTDFQNPIYLGPNADTSSAPIVEVNAGAGGDHAVLSGVISGGNSLTKIGNGRLALSATNINTGPVHIRGGVLSVDALANGGVPSGIGQSSNAASNLTFGNSAILQYTGPSVATDRGFTLNAGGGGFDVQANSTLRVSGNGVGIGRFIKNGAGMFVLAGTNSYTGGTTINSGNLAVLGSIPGPVTVNNTGTLLGTGGVAGVGRVAGAVQVNEGGTLSMGDDSATNSTGILYITGPVALKAGANFRLDIRGAIAGIGASHYDRLDLTGGGSIALGNANLQLFLDYAPEAADTITFITGGNVSGMFSGLPNNSSLFVGNFDGLGYTANINYAANSVFLNNFTAIPEPSQLLSISVLMVAVTRWRNRDGTPKTKS